VLKRIFSNILAWEPVIRGLRHRMLADTIVMLMYHELVEDDADIDAWTVVRRSSFLRQMEYLRTHFDVVSLEEAIARRARPARSSRPVAVITFDDGDRGNVDILLPIVERLELPVAIFVATRQIVEQRSYWFDDVMNALQTVEPVRIELSSHGLGDYHVNTVRGPRNWVEIQRLLTDLKGLLPVAREQAVCKLLADLQGKAKRPGSQLAPLSLDGLRALSACPLVTVGAHSHCHNILTQIESAEVMESVATSKRLLETWTGKDVWSFAYPNGDFDDEVVDVVRRLGFRCAIGTGERLWEPEDSLFGIPRMGVGLYDSLATFKLSLLGGLRNVVMAAPWRTRAPSKSAIRTAREHRV
jgi:peptidoglycan/xylan/chitin deacetylase (PgdA/CDA1 family)